MFNLRAKLDATGYYDDFEVDRVVEAELRGSKQSDLVAALVPVEDRLTKRYKVAQEAFRAAIASNNQKAAKADQDEMNALVLFKSDIGAFVRLYTFLSQIFDYGNTAIEKRAIFFRRLRPLLEFGGEREPTTLTKDVAKHAQFLVTKGYGYKCPYVPGTERHDSPLADPNGRPLETSEKLAIRFASVCEVCSPGKGGLRVD